MNINNGNVGVGVIQKVVNRYLHLQYPHCYCFCTDIMAKAMYIVQLGLVS